MQYHLLNANLTDNSCYEVLTTNKRLMVYPDLIRLTVSGMMFNLMKKSRASRDLYGHVVVYIGQMMYAWSVDKVHANTQYLLRELGRGRLIRDS